MPMTLSAVGTRGRKRLRLALCGAKSVNCHVARVGCRPGSDEPVLRCSELASELFYNNRHSLLAHRRRALKHGERRARICSQDGTDLFVSKMPSAPGSEPGALSTVDLTTLAALDRASLQQLWHELWGRPRPGSSSRSLLRYGRWRRLGRHA